MLPPAAEEAEPPALGLLLVLLHAASAPEKAASPVAVASP